MARKKPTIVNILGVELPRRLTIPLELPTDSKWIANGIVSENEAENSARNQEYQKQVTAAKVRRFEEIIAFVVQETEHIDGSADLLERMMLFEIMDRFSPGMQIKENVVGAKLKWDMMRLLHFAISMKAARAQNSDKNDVQAVQYVVENFDAFSVPEDTTKRRWIITLKTRYSRKDFRLYRKLADLAVEGEMFENKTEEEAALSLQSSFPELPLQQ